MAGSATFAGGQERVGHVSRIIPSRRGPAAACARGEGGGPYPGGMIRDGTAALATAGGLAGLGYYLVVTGKLTVDTGWGRRVRPLGPFGVEVPAPHITEEFALTEHDGTTRLDYSGELGTDFAAAGRWWADRVAAVWEAAVRSSFTTIKAEAERRTNPGAPDH